MLTPHERMLVHFAAQEACIAVRFNDTENLYRRVDTGEIWSPTDDGGQALDLATDLGMIVETPKAEGSNYGCVHYRSVLTGGEGAGVDQRKLVRMLIVEAAADSLMQETAPFQEGYGAFSRMRPCDYPHDSLERSLWLHGYNTAANPQV